MQPLALVLMKTLQCLENSEDRALRDRNRTQNYIQIKVRTIEKIGNQETKALTHLLLGCEVMSGFPPSFCMCFFLHFPVCLNTHFYDQRKT